MFKAGSGSRIPIKVDVNWDHVQSKKAVFEKFKRYNMNFSGSRIKDWKLVYKNGNVIQYLPGTSTPFTVKAYKDDFVLYCVIKD